MPRDAVPSLISSRRWRIREWWEALPKPDEQEGGTASLLFDGSSTPGGLWPDFWLSLALQQHWDGFGEMMGMSPLLPCRLRWCRWETMSVFRPTPHVLYSAEITWVTLSMYKSPPSLYLVGSFLSKYWKSKFGAHTNVTTLCRRKGKQSRM